MQTKEEVAKNMNQLYRRNEQLISGFPLCSGKIKLECMNDSKLVGKRKKSIQRMIEPFQLKLSVQSLIVAKRFCSRVDICARK